ncbi:DUF2789 domain-containing protein [Aquirhabdus parva]|uniref:DUF2789 domain-containing protein n=1 Tax=Aquirhabdus parva TaxID=2283318 RepID=A0A345P7S2_9GAMM|nr:DUF2789 domain-containing protein [Aquirhabdus parva]AXI03331.1 DUF2789 domain-containing protein [Aquirhabdus parva]
MDILDSYTIENLFAQLGLANSPEAISAFIKGHHLSADVQIADAPFWNEGQLQFIQESLDEDADWAEVVDELNALLHE